MTAQVAIMNRVGVALAADSAVSVRPGVFADRKIYSSVDKLFILSNSEPVGVMINGRAEYLGMPVETLIKEFRDSKFSTPQRTVADYARRFFEFLGKQFPGTLQDARDYAATIAVYKLQRLVKHAEELFEEAVESGERPSFGHLLAEHCLEEVNAGLEIARARAPLIGITSSNLPQDIGEIVRHAIDRTFESGFRELEAPMTELISLLMTRQIDSGESAQFVFAGFGTEQRFPAIVATDCDGPLVGTHKVRFTDDGVIDDETPALIRPFAQVDMVNRLVDGVDETYSHFLTGAIGKALERYADYAMSKVSRRKPSAALRAELAILGELYVGEILAGANVFRETTYRRSLLEGVQFMPKSDLAALAKSIVNLQSINETVGGPIDVAVISKHDGFVWIERKHYFDAEINSRFLAKQTSRVNRWMSEYGESGEQLGAGGER
ncbi:hypothetical protein [Sphingomonas soli]|uniref:hypothetical protein n=1 Tax=Sphingomonas soli TaxID=266127 RepID=UPI0012EE8A8D|nr:hypothetical protein [Sphingomonas soli]